MRKLFSSTLIFILAIFASALPVHAQLDGAKVLSADQIAKKIYPLHPKTVVMVFDVTMSTMHNGIFSLERSAAATLIENGCQIGDRVVLIKFGTGYKAVFDQVLTENVDKDTLINEIPGKVEAGHGTNIRWPHHEALRIVDASLPHPGVIVLMTDSYNDRPELTDPNYPHYLDYYSLKGLTIYPKTSQNRDYERLLRTIAVPGKIKQYGVGVGIAKNGRPIERLPLPGQGDNPTAGNDTGETTTTETVTGTEKAGANYLPWILLALLLLLILIALYFILHRPIVFSLKLGEKALPRDYRLSPEAKVGIGGSSISAAPGDDVFPLAGISTPAAFIKAARGAALTILPTAAASDSGIKVLHNGMRLEREVPIRMGDEIRVAIDATESSPIREYRISVLKPQ